MRLIENATEAKVYHVTPKRNVPRIMRDGLQPRIGPRSKKGREKIASIYVFPDWLSCEDGMSNWLIDEFDETTPLSVLELTIPTSWLHRDQLQWEAEIRQVVPPDHIRVVISNIDEWTGGTPPGVNLASDDDDV